MALDIFYKGQSRNMRGRQEEAEKAIESLRSLNLEIPESLTDIVNESFNGVNIDTAIVKEDEFVYINLDDIPSHVDVIRIHFSR